MKLALVTVLVAACSDPTFALRFRVTAGSEAACRNDTGDQVTSCGDVTMMCRAAVSIRIFSPNDPTSPYISICKELAGHPDGSTDVCSIAGVDLAPPPVPVNGQTLEVQIAVYPLAKLPTDPTTGDLQCPTTITYDAHGFPVESIQPCSPSDVGDCPASPSIGGVAFYHPGDSETVVDLGCTDLEQLNDTSCTGLTEIGVTATVDDFDTLVSVQPSLADTLEVAINAPRPLTGTDGLTHYVLPPPTVNTLARPQGSMASWTGTVAEPFDSQCLEVLEVAPGTTTSVRCQPFATPPIQAFNAKGTRISKETLADIVHALSLSDIPADGLVVGIVLDSFGNPLANVQVTTSRDDGMAAGTIGYLSADRHSVGVTSTSSNGIFVSQNAPYATAFHASSMLQSTSGFGGLIDGKVSIVVLQFQAQTANM